MNPYYDHAGIVIYHGDCREILPKLGRFDLLLTDPPYGAGYAANPIVGKGKSQSNHADQDWDGSTVDADDFYAIMGAASEAIIWGGNYYHLRPSRCWLAWYKRDAPPSMAQMELAWVSRDGNAKLFDYPIAAVNAERIGHPTQKPLALMKWCLTFFPLAKSVLDPFMGSGTTLVAAQNLGRKAIGIEIEEKYCQIAVERLRQQTLFPAEPLSGYKMETQGELYGAPTNGGNERENRSG